MARWTAVWLVWLAACGSGSGAGGRGADVPRRTTLASDVASPTTEEAPQTEAADPDARPDTTRTAPEPPPARTFDPSKRPSQAAIRAALSARIQLAEGTELHRAEPLGDGRFALVVFGGEHRDAHVFVVAVTPTGPGGADTTEVLLDTPLPSVALNDYYIDTRVLRVRAGDADADGAPDVEVVVELPGHAECGTGAAIYRHLFLVEPDRDSPLELALTTTFDHEAEVPTARGTVTFADRNGDGHPDASLRRRECRAGHFDCTPARTYELLYDATADAWRPHGDPPPPPDPDMYRDDVHFDGTTIAPARTAPARPAPCGADE